MTRALNGISSKMNAMFPIIGGRVRTSRWCIVVARATAVTSIKHNETRTTHSLAPFINNAFHQEKTVPRRLINPATEQPYCFVNEGTADHVDTAVEAAKSAFSRWRKHTGEQRRDLVFALAAAMQRRHEELSQLETLSGKPICQSRMDITECIETFKYYAGHADKLASSYFSPTLHTRFQPYGVVGLIVAFNYPLLLASWKLAPALCAGNTVVIKSSPQTPHSVLRLAELAKSVGFPDGVINVVPGGVDVGKRISLHPDISKISFTGSTPTGKSLIQTVSQTNLKSLTLELGGKAAMIVTSTADIDRTIPLVIDGAFANAGQNCCQGSRLLVHEDVYDVVMTRLKEEVQRMKVGDPVKEDTDLGPVIDETAFKRLMTVMSDANIDVERGAIQRLCGGQRIGDYGYFIAPTVYTQVPQDHSLANTELFGPILTVMKPFTSLKTAISVANSTPYGLASAVFSTSRDEIEQCVDGLNVGTVWINEYNVIKTQTPFGGWRESGWGSELGVEGLREWMKVKTVVGR